MSAVIRPVNDTLRGCKKKKEAKSNETASIAEESAMINYIQRSKDRYKRRVGRK
jgi:hypothetical protein